MNDSYDFYLESIKSYTDKMTPADYLYLSDRIWDFENRLEEIKNR
jgi:hypothetical protein